MFGITPPVFEWNDLFPVCEIQFENYRTYAPRDTDKYLQNLYGDYMTFPRRGLQHHTIYADDEQVRVCDFAKRNGIDILELHEQLKDIEAFFRAQI